MELLTMERSLELVGPDPVLVAAFDGWTDAGEGGTAAADALRDAFEPIRLAAFPSDALYDYRDRRPALSIDQGVLSRPDWPEVIVELLQPPSGPPLLLIGGPEPDLAWRTLTADLVELARLTGATRYVGFGAVPGPIPHTRPVQLIATSSDAELLERIGRPHEQVVVPASCQVALEAELAAAGLQTLGMWVRIPHYVAGEYPEAARALLEQLMIHLGTPVDLSELDEDIADNRARLDVAAQGSGDIREHVGQLERIYDAEIEAARLSTRHERTPNGLGALSEEQVPSADALAAEIERFLQGRKD